MPTMYEIYNSSAHEYDELVTHEDYQNNLQMFLHTTIDWDKKSVIEFGIGTGRVTRVYIDRVKTVTGYDRSAHMLQRAAENLSDYPSKISFNVCDNLDIQSLDAKADIVIEGWSFGHTVGDHQEKIEETVADLVSSCASLLNPGGTLIFIETLGTNVPAPIEPGIFLPKFYSLLETKYGFHRFVISTDYKFESCQEATRIAGYFFGDAMKNEILRSRSNIIPEFTGVWIKSSSD
jgi:ubiquinone/menaquinone biosynthesis C-methylase UbiE